jgi:hypothetical protein
MANSWIQEEMGDKRRVDTLWEHENMNNSNGWMSEGMDQWRWSGLMINEEGETKTVERALGYYKYDDRKRQSCPCPAHQQYYG